MTGATISASPGNQQDKRPQQRLPRNGRDMPSSNNKNRPRPDSDGRFFRWRIEIKRMPEKR
jgi:hypothetical protein